MHKKRQYPIFRGSTMTNKKRKDTFGNGLIAFLFICMIFLMGYAFKNPILLYSTKSKSRDQS